MKRLTHMASAIALAMSISEPLNKA